MELAVRDDPGDAGRFRRPPPLHVQVRTKPEQRGRMLRIEHQRLDQRPFNRGVHIDQAKNRFRLGLPQPADKFTGLLGEGHSVPFGSQLIGDPDPEHQIPVEDHDGPQPAPLLFNQFTHALSPMLNAALVPIIRSGGYAEAASFSRFSMIFVE
jgi:hypothetical protein